MQRGKIYRESLLDTPPAIQDKILIDTANKIEQFLGAEYVTDLYRNPAIDASVDVALRLNVSITQAALGLILFLDKNDL